MFVAIDGRPAGLLGVADPIKASTPEAHPGARAATACASSCSPATAATTAEAVARKLGIDEVEAEVLPEQKADVVKRLQARGTHRGDGRRRHQRRAGAGAGRTSASRWAPAPTWRWRAPASRW